MSGALTSGLDRLLDVSVVLGYTRVGHGLRRAWWPADPGPDSLRGRTVAVTGANSGLGEATAAGVAALGADVVLLCRNVEKGEQARARVAAQHPGAGVSVLACDVSDLDSLPEVARSLGERTGALHALVHNAGVMPPERSEVSGHETALTTHVLGPHVLTHLLRPLLAADGDARVVLVSSGGMYSKPLRVDDPESREGEYSGVDVYARTKRMQVHLAQTWGRRLRPAGVAVHSMHPGWAATPGVTESLPGFAKVTGPLLRTPAQGADTAVWLTASPDASAVAATGLFWHDRRPRPVTHPAGPRVAASEVEELWRYVVAATGVPSADDLGA